jgi:hypothetical protein
MRLSLRTLLAFEDNIFDVEQHRQLEQVIPKQDDAAATLSRIRSVVRDPCLGVPGIVNHREELDPNFVAEYLDHQMDPDLQERFETYCLSSDKYLAEVAAVHQILSNVLGEPARTSRECRLRCYEVLKKPEYHNNQFAQETTFDSLLKPFEPSNSSSKEYEASLAANRGTRPLFSPAWNFFSNSKPEPKEPTKKSSHWSFLLLGLLTCTALLGWQQLEKRYHQAPLAETVADAVTETTNEQPLPVNMPEPVMQPPAELPASPVNSFASPVQQAGFAEDVPNPSSAASIPASINDPFLTQVAETETTAQPVEEKPEAQPPARILAAPGEPDVMPPVPVPPTRQSEESIIAFQPINSPPVKQTAEVPRREPQVAVRATLPPTSWQPQHLESAPPRVPVEQPLPPNALGRVVASAEASLVFSAMSASDQWNLLPQPFLLKPEQYLLSVTPFRGLVDLIGGFRIEMVGDAKLCVLPPDARGIPGIYVDYGRIVIFSINNRQAQLRIETEKSQGIVMFNGQNSKVFVDTFAAVIDKPAAEVPQQGQVSVTTPILGFVPDPNEPIVWRSSNQQTPLTTNKPGSILLHSERTEFGRIQHLPNWLRANPLSPNDRNLAETCRRIFSETNGQCEAALRTLVRDSSNAVRTFGFRLWGDLGRFDVPLVIMADKNPEDEQVRQVLVPYFNEVMKRDEETVQRLADAIKAVRR